MSDRESRLLDRSVPDIPLRLSDGRVLPLSALWRERPLLVTFFYRRCTGVCVPFLQELRDASRAAGGLGVDYQVLALSFNDADTARDVRGQAAALGLLDSPDWFFAVTGKADVERIAGALEFWYRYDPGRRQYEHEALLVGIEKGRVVRAMVAGARQANRIRELIWETRGSFIPFYAVPGQTPVTCLAFDPGSGETRLDWGMLLLALPAVLALLAATALFGLCRRPVADQ